jgi:hypothetical protein
MELYHTILSKPQFETSSCTYTFISLTRNSLSAQGSHGDGRCQCKVLMRLDDMVPWAIA